MGTRRARRCWRLLAAWIVPGRSTAGDEILRRLTAVAARRRLSRTETPPGAEATVRFLPLRLSTPCAALTIALVSGCIAPVASDPPAVEPTSASQAVASQSALPTAMLITPPADRYVVGGLEYFEWLVACAAENGEVVRLDDGDPPGIGWTTNSRTERIVNQCRETAEDEGWSFRIPSMVRRRPTASSIGCSSACTAASARTDTRRLIRPQRTPSPIKATRCGIHMPLCRRGSC